MHTGYLLVCDRLMSHPPRLESLTKMVFGDGIRVPPTSLTWAARDYPLPAVVGFRYYLMGIDRQGNVLQTRSGPRQREQKDTLAVRSGEQYTVII